MKRFIEREAGQSIIIIALAMVALMALLALVVDAGNAYVQRRKVQNAADAGAQAGAVALAKGGITTIKIQVVNDQIRDYVQRNGVNPADVTAKFVVQDASGNLLIDDYTIAQHGLNNLVPDKIWVQGNQWPIVGVQVAGGKTFNTYFAGVVGWDQMKVGGGSAAVAKCGACSAGKLFPIAVNAQVFYRSGVLDVHTEQEDTTTYTIYENSSDITKQFGYVFWRDEDTTSALVTYMNDTSQSGTWAYDSYVEGNWGLGANSSVKSAVEARESGTSYNCVTKPSTCVTVPIFDSKRNSAPATEFHVKGFARLRIVDSCMGSTGSYGNCPSGRWIKVKVQTWTDPVAEGGCTDFAVCTVKVRPVITPTRTIIGTVEFNKLTKTSTTAITTHVPVDVVEVFDLSDSMNRAFSGASDGSKEKLIAAKSAFKAFNQNMQVTNDASTSDRLGLVTFPKYGTQNRYRPVCNPSYYESSAYTAELKKSLNFGTTWVASVNSTIDGLTANYFTPTAEAIRNAGIELMGGNHRPGNVRVMILATDGLANVTPDDDRFLGGGSWDYEPCNLPAIQAATDQATYYKGDNDGDGQPDVIIFVIAVGSEWTTADYDEFESMFRAIATMDTDPARKHFMVAGSSADLATIYAGISDRVMHIGNETCKIIQTKAAAPTARVYYKRDNGAEQYVDTGPNGEFVITNPTPGTYEFTRATVTVDGVTYDKFTVGIGGADLTTNPKLTITSDYDTIPIALYLRNSTPVSCQ